MRRPTMADVAKSANVSLSTVDRVLSGRFAVRRENAERVIAAASALGFHATGLMQRRVGAEPPRRRLGFLLQQPADHFHGLLGRTLTRAGKEDAEIRCETIVEFIDGLDVGTVVDRLTHLSKQVDAMAILVADHAQLSRVIERVVGGGVPVIALISDLEASKRTGFIGLDNRKVGRTAGWVLSQLCGPAGKVAISLGSHRLSCQHVAEDNCRAYLRERCPNFEIVDSPTNFEQPRFAYENARDLLARHPDLNGLFVAGGGLEGVMAAVREAGAADQLKTIGRELTPQSRAGLLDGTLSMVISHPITALAQGVVKTLARAVATPVTFQEMILPIELYTPESV